MANVTCSRIVSTAASSPMTATFLTAVRAAGVTRSAAGFIVDGAGTTRACYVNASGNWDLTTTLANGMPVDARTFTDLRTNPATYSRAFVAVTLANGIKQGVAVLASPGDPIDPG